MHRRRLQIAAACAFMIVFLSPTLTHAAPPVTPPIQEYAVDASMFKHIYDNMQLLDVSEFDDDLQPRFHEAIPEVELPFPDLRAPMQDVIRPRVLHQIAQ